MHRKLQRAELPGTLQGPAPSQQMQTPTDTNAILQARNTHLEKAYTDLEADNRRLVQKLKYHQVAETILLAITAGLGAGLGTGIAGATVSTALSASAAVLFGVIMASMAILAFMHRLLSGAVPTGLATLEALLTRVNRRDPGGGLCAANDIPAQGHVTMDAWERFGDRGAVGGLGASELHRGLDGEPRDRPVPRPERRLEGQAGGLVVSCSLTAFAARLPGLF